MTTLNHTSILFPLLRVLLTVPCNQYIWASFTVLNVTFLMCLGEKGALRRKCCHVNLK